MSNDGYTALIVIIGIVFVLIAIFISFLFGKILQDIAFKKGYPERYWFWLGFFYNFFGVLILLMVSAMSFNIKRLSNPDEKGITRELFYYDEHKTKPVADKPVDEKPTSIIVKTIPDVQVDRTKRISLRLCNVNGAPLTEKQRASIINGINNDYIIKTTIDKLGLAEFYYSKDFSEDEIATLKTDLKTK